LRYSALAGSLSGALNGAFRKFVGQARDDVSNTLQDRERIFYPGP
jgi:hypothetical protein